MIHPQTDSKKRTSLVISYLKPGPSPFPWLPNLRTMISKGLLLSKQQQDPSILIKNDVKSFGIKPPLKSYSSNSVIWLDAESVQADLQKVIRHARRLPERASHFVKELNRVRRAAISYGYYDVLDGLTSMIEREKEIAKLDPEKGDEHINYLDKVIAYLRSELTENSYDTVINF